MVSEKNPIKRLGDQLFFTGPIIAAFLAVVIVPFVYGVYLTFLSWDGISSNMPFNGLGNYALVLHDGKFWASVWLTVKYVLASVILVNGLAFLLAYLVTNGIKGQNFFRTAIFTPNLIGGLVLGFLWQFIFNQVLPLLGDHLRIFKTSWLSNDNMAFWALVVVTVWHFAGYMMVIFIAGFMSLPRDILEASTIDGAGGWVRLTRMILPLMVPSIIVTIFLTLQKTFMVYDVNFSLTGGGPYGSTVLASMFVFDKAFKSYQYAVGQAEAFVLFLLVAIVTLLQVYFSKKLEVEA